MDQELIHHVATVIQNSLRIMHLRATICKSTPVCTLDKALTKDPIKLAKFIATHHGRV